MNKKITEFMREIAKQMRGKLFNKDEITVMKQKIFSFDKDDRNYILLYLTPFGDEIPFGEWDNLTETEKDNFTRNYTEIILSICP